MRDDRMVLTEKQKKYLMGLLLLAAVGLCVLSTSENEDALMKQDSLQQYETTEAESSAEREAKQLGELLGKIDGVGKVEVMIRFEQSDEMVYATEKRDIQGEQRQGELQQQETNYEETIAMQSISGGEQPVVIKKMLPEAMGVLIVAQGAENDFVKNRLMEGAATYFGIPMYRISVLPMEGESEW